MFVKSLKAESCAAVHSCEQVVGVSVGVISVKFTLAVIASDHFFQRKNSENSVNSARHFVKLYLYLLTLMSSHVRSLRWQLP